MPSTLRTVQDYYYLQYNEGWLALDPLMGGQVVYTSRLSSDYPISLPAIAILRSRVALTVIPLLTFKLRYGKGQIWHNATIPFRVYDLGLTNIASSMSQIAVVILNWIIQSVFQEDYTGPFIQTPSSSLFGAVIQYNQNNGFAYICLGSYW